MWHIKLSLTILGTSIFIGQAQSQSANSPPLWPEKFAVQLCETGFEIADLAKKILADAPSGLISLTPVVKSRRFYAAIAALQNGNRLDVNARFIGQANQQTRLSFFEANKGPGVELIPRLLIDLGANCSLRRAAFLTYKADGRLHSLQHFSKNLKRSDTTELLNPPVPAGEDPGGVAVAHFDSGVNYLLPFIARRLARNSSGEILGYDFNENDTQPFDLDPVSPAFLPRRHGTSVISILLREAPEVRIIPFRHPGRDISRFGEMVEAITKTPARIVAMPLGGYKRQQWENFARAAQKYPELLFVISAGNDGRNIDVEPVYPASFDLDNFIVVTSTDAFGRLPAESNWGVKSVDISTPAERLDVIDHRGAKGKASGSSYAVPRIAALAARLAMKHPDWTASEIKSAIVRLAGPRPRAKPATKYGWIALPDQEGF